MQAEPQIYDFDFDARLILIFQSRFSLGQFRLSLSQIASFIIRHCTETWAFY